MKIIRIFIIALCLVSCGATVNYDYDSQTDFSKYKTYNYFTDMESGLSELDLKRLISALDKEMVLKGYTLAEDADFYIDIQSQEVTFNNGNNVGVGVGGTGRNVGGGVSIGFPINSNKRNREIVIDFVDKDRTKLFWQAVSESSFNPKAKPEKREADFAVLVAKILSKYPPK